MSDGERKKGLSSESGFVEIVTKCYFVDKSLLIKELIDDCDDEDNTVKIITRPRRFGKSVNLNMVKTFFEKTDGDTSVYFKDLKIWECGEKYTSEQGGHPVVYLDLKNGSGDCWDSLYGDIKKTIANEYKRHDKELVGCVPECLFNEYNRIILEEGTDADYIDSLRLLTELLCRRFGEKTVVLVDEYDAPYQTGCDRGYGGEVLDFLSSFFSAAFEGNGEFLKFVVPIGITRVFDEGNIDNAEYCSVWDDRYGKYFGFTKEETADFFDCSEKKAEVGKWCGGYRFVACGDMRNPWAVSHYLYNKCTAKSYWSDTSSNPLVKEAVAVSKKVAKNLTKLSRGETVSVLLSKALLYSEERCENNIYAALVEAGYLTPVSGGGGKYDVKIPNRGRFGRVLIPSKRSFWGLKLFVVCCTI